MPSPEAIINTVVSSIALAITIVSFAWKGAKGSGITEQELITLKSDVTELKKEKISLVRFTAVEKTTVDTQAPVADMAVRKEAETKIDVMKERYQDEDRERLSKLIAELRQDVNDLRNREANRNHREKP